MPKVLVVDDEPSMVKVLSGFLAQEKIPCVTAPNGEAALRVLHAEDIGVIVTDLKMTGMDGLQLLEHALNIDPSLQVILMTALADLGGPVRVGDGRGGLCPEALRSRRDPVRGPAR